MLAGEQELDISDEQLLLNGLGVVYRQGGAQYDLPLGGTGKCRN